VSAAGTLLDVANRARLQPWAEEEKIPWDDPAFSARMLREHLSQQHDAASRRFAMVDRHVRWLADRLPREGARILDLGCGPGLYTSRLARLGHRCVGIDFSPALVEHARQEALRNGLACEYRQQDLRAGAFGEAFDLVLLCNGELNVFRPEEAAAILREAHHSLAAAGQIVLEVHTFDAVRALGRRPPRWYTRPEGLFADSPHLVLEEAAWEPGQRAAIQRYFVVDAASGRVTRHGATVQAYKEADYDALLLRCGFENLERLPSLDGSDDPAQKDLFVLTGVSTHAPSHR
jgi:SAM-dependent methyltransferase